MRDSLDDDDETLYWWPCRVINQMRGTLRVERFGDAAGLPQGSSSVSEDETRSFELQKDQPRFDAFADAVYLRSDHQKPAKMQRMDLGEMEDKWKLALQEAQRANVSAMQWPNDDDDDDDLPDVSMAFSAAYQPSPPDGTDTDVITVDSDSDSSLTDISEEHHVPVPDVTVKQDMSLQIPGELLMAQSKAGSKEFWPAKLLEFCPAYNPRLKEREQYRVLFLDGLERVIRRSWFYTSNDDEFFQCTMGPFDSARPQFDMNSDDTEVYQDTLREAIRDPSPAPSPQFSGSAGNDFSDLTLREQFTYTKPIMTAILRDEYEPASDRRRGFLRGGGSRQAVVKQASNAGDMDLRELPVLLGFVTYWCLRGDTQAEVDRDFQWETDGLLEHVAAEAPTLSQLSSVAPPGDSSSPAGTEEVVRSSSPGTTAPDGSQVPAPSRDIQDDTATGEPENTITNFDPPQVLLSDEIKIAELEKEIAADPSARQHGCKAYEQLGKKDKLDFCVNVLLPEMVIQLYLWRAKKRTTTALLSPAEEQAMHVEAEKLLAERDWVWDVINMRGMKTTTVTAKVQREPSLPEDGSGRRRIRSRARKNR